MFESAIPQNNSNLAAEKGPGCDIRHRFALSAVYEIPGLGASGSCALIANWRLSRPSIRHRLDSRSPFRCLAIRPMPARFLARTQSAPTTRANRSSARGRAPPTSGSIRRLSPHRAAFTFGNVGRNTIYGPGMQTLDLAVTREFAMTEKVEVPVPRGVFQRAQSTNLGTPNRFVNTPQFGTITEATTPGRQIQFSARVSF